MDIKQLIEFKQCLMNDFIRVKHENSILSDEVAKPFSKPLECVFNIKVDVEPSMAEFYVNERNLFGPDLSTYILYTPKKADSKSSMRSCKGCGQQFKTNCNANSLLPFYEHCIRDCDKYKKLNLIRSCEGCRLLFMNRNSYRMHVNLNSKCELSQRRRTKPDWAPKSNLQWNQMHSSQRWNVSINCPGCGQQFRGLKPPCGRFTKEIAYYRHCFDECEEYKKLNLIRSCSECDRKFINAHSLKIHCGASGHENNSDTRWYSCQGCGQHFMRTDCGRKTYYKHCIKACDQYRKLNLIKTCYECDKSFMDEYGLMVHRRQKHSNKKSTFND